MIESAKTTCPRIGIIHTCDEYHDSAYMLCINDNMLRLHDISGQIIAERKLTEEEIKSKRCKIFEC